MMLIRSCHGQWLVQSAGDIFLGWASAAATSTFASSTKGRLARSSKHSTSISWILTPQLCASTLARARAQRIGRPSVQARGRPWTPRPRL